MKILAFILVCCLMEMGDTQEMGESLEDHIGDEATLIDLVLEDLPVKKCHSIIVSRSPLQDVGRSTIFFTNIDDLITFMREEEAVVHTLNSMTCLILVVKSDNFAATASLIDFFGQLPGTPPKNKKKHFLFVTPTIDHGLLRNKSYNFNVHLISPTEAGVAHQITSLCPALGFRYALILPGMCDPSLQDPMGKILPVSFIGMDPYIQYNEESIAYGGAEFELIDTYAKAYGFTPKLRREPTYDSSTWDARGEGETFIRGPVAKDTNHWDAPDESIFRGMVGSVHTKQSEIGIGQATIVPYRYKLIEYLPWQYLYNFEVQSQKPYQIVTYDALTIPFDNITWGLLFGLSIFVFGFLVFIQKLWIWTTGEKPPNAWMFQDLVLSLTVGVDETIPYELFQRSSFWNSRRLLLIMWIVMANVLSYAYKGTLLSTLVIIRYSVPLDNVEQVRASGIPFQPLDGTVMVWLAESDPRPIMVEMVKSGQITPMAYDGAISQENLEKIDNGEACVLTTHTVRAKFKNRHHFSKESLADFYSAHIVPKGSPLLDVFHMGTHWMQATGIFPKIMDPYMNALPEQPLRKLRDPDEALMPVQIIMLFIVWGFGTAFAIISFVVELGYGIHNTDLNDVMRPWEREQFPTKDILEEAGKNLSYDSRFPEQILNKRKEDPVVHHGDNGDITFLQ